MKKILALFVVLMAASYAAAQGACYPDGFAATTTSTLNNSTVRVISFANIRVCTEPASGTPCTPLTNIYSNPDLASGHALPNPFQADASGNFHFCVASPSTVHIQISGPQVTTQDIPYVTLGIGGGGGGATPCGILYDVQINDPLGTFGCDSGIFTENPNTHILDDWIFNAAQEVEISDTTHSGVADLGSTNGTAVHNHFKFGVTDTLSADYGLCPPDTAPPGSGYHWTISSGTPVSPTWAGGGSCYPGEWVSDAEGATIYLAGLDSGTSGTNYALTSGNLNSNSNGCPVSLTTGVTANVVPTHSNSSTTPTFQLCGLSSPAVIVKNGTSGEVPLAVNDIVSGGSASTIRLTYNGVTSHWAIQNPTTPGVGNCPGLAGQNTYCAGPLNGLDPRSAVVQDKMCTIGDTPTCTGGGLTVICSVSSSPTSFAHCQYSIDQSIQAGDTAYVEFTAVPGLGGSGINNSMSDTQGNTWTRIVNDDGSGSTQPAASYWTHPGAGADTISVNFDTSAGFQFRGVFHFIELRGTVSPDGNGFNSGSGFPFQPVTTINNTDTILGDQFIFQANCTYTPGTNFGLINQIDGTVYSSQVMSMGGEAQNVLTAGSYTPSITATGSGCSGGIGSSFTQAFTQSVYGGPGIPSFRWPKWVDLVAGLDFTSQAGHGGQCIAANAAGLDYQPLVWATCGSAGVTSIQFKNAGTNFGSPMTGTGSMNFVNATVSGTAPNFTVTVSGAGDTITSPNSTISVGGSSSATTLDVVGAAGEILTGATPALTRTPALGTDGSNAGTLQLANGSSSAHTIFGSAATTSNTILGPATVIPTNHIVGCATSSTTCTLTDLGTVPSGAGSPVFKTETATYTVLGTDFSTPSTGCGKIWVGSGAASTMSVHLPSTTPAAGQCVDIWVYANSIVTIDTAGAQNVQIAGSSSGTKLGQGMGVEISTDGTDYLGQGLVLPSNDGSDTAFGQNTFISSGGGSTYFGQNINASGSGSGSNNTYVGKSIGASGSGSSNTAVGYGALPSLSGGSQNTIVGLSGGFSIVGGSNNSCFGYGGCGSISSGTNNALFCGGNSSCDTPGGGTTNYLNIGQQIIGDTSKGILIFKGPTTSIASNACGSSTQGTLATGSNDMVGEVTVGTAATTSCAVSFANTHNQAPFCTVTSQAGATVIGFGYSISTSTLTVTATSGFSSTKFDYHCFAGSTSNNPTP